MAKDLFGTLAVRKGYATESEVDVALEAQRDQEGSAPRIGEILVEMGTLTTAKVRALLAEQGSLDDLPAAPRLVQQSGPPIRVNGVPLEAVRALEAGDRVEIAGAVFSVEGAGVEMAPAPLSASPTVSTTQLPAATPVTAQVPATSEPAPASPGVPPLARIDALFARILPSVHNHRKFLALALLPGLFAILLPWRLATETRWVFGIQGPGWITFLCSAFALVFLLAGPRPKSLRKPEKTVVLAATGLALALSLWKLFFPPAWAMALGIGLPLALLSSIAAVLAGAFCKAEAGTFTETAFGLAGRALRDVSGKRGKEKFAAMERRDELLRQLGEAALETNGAPGADADAAAKVKAAHDEAKKSTGPQAKPALKAAEGKLRRALQKLGRGVADQALPLDGRQLPTAELLALDAKIKELG